MTDWESNPMPLDPDTARRMRQSALGDYSGVNEVINFRGASGRRRVRGKDCVLLKESLSGFTLG